MNAVNFLETGVIHCEDNLRTLAQFPAECVDLVYLDPPFFSNRVYEVIWGDEAEVRSFADRWEGGIQVYVDWMEARLRHLHRLLKPTGSLYLHCDQAAGHYLKVLLDSIFGQANFRNEIVWRRTGSNSAKKRFGPIHQTIFYYAKTKKTPFYPVYGRYTKRYIKEKFRFVDERGRFQDVALTGSGRRDGDSAKQWRDYDPTALNRHWQPSSYVYDKYAEVVGDDLGRYPMLERLDRLDAAGLLYWTRKGVPRYRYYLDDAPGVALQDIWGFQPGTEGTVYGSPDEGIDEDVKWLGNRDPERVGYPTQKPEALLARIIRSSTKKDEVILDPFCGCGTTVAAAAQLGRQWIGIDISPQAVEIIRARLAKLGSAPQVHGVPTSEDDLKRLLPFEFQHWVIQQVLGNPHPRKTGDMGIDGYSFFEGLPIQVKQSERVGRPDVDSFETAIRREGKHQGYLVAFSFTRGAYEEAARSKQGSARVVLVKVADILRVGELVEAADRAGRAPQIDGQVTPDLMGLFGALTREVRDRPDYRPPDKKPSEQQLVENVRRARGVERLPV